MSQFPSFQNPYSSPFGQSDAAGTRNPWQRFGRGVSGQTGTRFPSFDRPSMDTFFRRQGYEPNDDGSFSRTMQGMTHQGRISRTNTMDPAVAQQRYNMAFNMGHQGAGAAMQDFEALSDIVATENVQRENLRGRMEAGFAGAEADRQAAVRGIREGGMADAAALEERAGADFEEFERYRDQTVRTTDDWARETADYVQQAVEDYDETAVDNISAGFAGMMASAKSQIQQVQNEARSQGLSPEAVQAQVSNIREQSLRQAQSQLSPLINQKNQMRLQASQQAGQVMNQAFTAAGQTRNWALTSTADLLKNKTRIAEAASGMRRASRLDAVQANAQFEQLKLAYGDREANVLQNLGQRYPSIYDSFLQAGFAVEAFGDRSPLNVGALT